MNIYLSHARKDSGLALQLAERLKSEGLVVLHPETEIVTGENWAKKIGKALQDADFMVFLLTPGAFDGDWMRMDVEFALGSRKFEGRVFSVFVGPASQLSTDVPWILLKLPHRQVESARSLHRVANEVKAQCTATERIASHA